MNSPFHCYLVIDVIAPWDHLHNIACQEHRRPGASSTRNGTMPKQGTLNDEASKKPAKAEPEVHIHDPSKLRGTLKLIGGSMSDDWNNILANQTITTLWLMPKRMPRRSGSNAMRRSTL